MADSGESPDKVKKWKVESEKLKLETGNLKPET
jgi:hypothetical protein